VVIFVQENRAFDHYFGTLAGVRGFADPSALQLQTGNSVFHQG
jgi:phospholipase C